MFVVKLNDKFWLCPNKMMSSNVRHRQEFKSRRGASAALNRFKVGRVQQYPDAVILEVEPRQRELDL